jgi:hypothetical protein
MLCRWQVYFWGLGYEDTYVVVVALGNEDVRVLRWQF